MMRCGCDGGAEGRPCESDLTPRGEKGEGWVRVGRYDAPRRRALWVRTTPWAYQGHQHEIQSIELCAGREGDDGYVRVTPDNPIFYDLLDVILRARDHLEHEAPETLV